MTEAWPTSLACAQLALAFGNAGRKQDRLNAISVIGPLDTHEKRALYFVALGAEMV